MVTLGTHVETNQRILFPDDDRLRHLLVVGKTGTGKSNLMLSLMIQDMQAGRGFTLIDPYGNLSDDVLAHVPRTREQDVVFLDLEEREYPFALNLFDMTGCRDEDELDRRVNAVGESFRRVWSGADSLLLQLWVKTIARTFMESRTGTLLEAGRLLTDSAYREPFLRRLTHLPSVDFWRQYTTRNGDLSRESLNAVMNRLRLILDNRLVQNIVGQDKTTIDFPRWINEEQIVILKLPITVGKEAMQMLGSFMMQRFLDAATRRSREKRHPYFLYVDEFHYFATTDFLDVVNGMRQFGIGMTAATQQLTNIDDDQIRRGIMGVRSLVLFNLTASDAATFARELHMEPTPRVIETIKPMAEDFVVDPKFFYLRAPNTTAFDPIRFIRGEIENERMPPGYAQSEGIAMIQKIIDSIPADYHWGDRECLHAAIYRYLVGKESAHGMLCYLFKLHLNRSFGEPKDRGLYYLTVWLDTYKFVADDEPLLRDKERVLPGYYASATFSSAQRRSANHFGSSKPNATLITQYGEHSSRFDPLEYAHREWLSGTIDRETFMYWLSSSISKNGASHKQPTDDVIRHYLEAWITLELPRIAPHLIWFANERASGRLHRIVTTITPPTDDLRDALQHLEEFYAVGSVNTRLRMVLRHF